MAKRSKDTETEEKPLGFVFPPFYRHRSAVANAVYPNVVPTGQVSITSIASDIAGKTFWMTLIG